MSDQVTWLQWAQKIPCDTDEEALQIVSDVTSELRSEGRGFARAQLFRLWGRVATHHSVPLEEILKGLTGAAEDGFEAKESKQAALEVLCQLAQQFPERMGTMEAIASAAEGQLGQEKPRLRLLGLSLLGASAPATGDRGSEAAGVLRSFLEDWSPDVRAAAADALRALHRRGGELRGPDYRAAAAAAGKDDFEEVRMAALRLMRDCALHCPEEIVGVRFGEPARLVDDAFLRTCNCVTDSSKRVRALSHELLGDMHAAASGVKLQALSKKMTAKVSIRKHSTAKGGMRGSADVSDDIDLMDGAAGAFVIGLEDETEAVRLAAVAAMEALGLRDPGLMAATDDLLVDMLNDEMPSVRLRTAQALVRLSAEDEARPRAVRLPEDQLKLLLCGLSDSSLDMRSAVARFVARLHFSTNAALLAAVQALIRGLAARPQDLAWVGEALRTLGERFCHFVEGVMPKLLGDAQKRQEPMTLEDPAHIGRLVFAFSAARRLPHLLPLLPPRSLSQLPELERAHPGLLPPLEVRNCGLGIFQVGSKRPRAPESLIPGLSHGGRTSEGGNGGGAMAGALDNGHSRRQRLHHGSNYKKPHHQAAEAALGNGIRASSDPAAASSAPPLHHQSSSRAVPASGP